MHDYPFACRVQIWIQSMVQLLSHLHSLVPYLVRGVTNTIQPAATRDVSRALQVRLQDCSVPLHPLLPHLLLASHLRIPEFVPLSLPFSLLDTLGLSVPLIASRQTPFTFR